MSKCQINGVKNKWPLILNLETVRQKLLLYHLKSYTSKNIINSKRQKQNTIYNIYDRKKLILLMYKEHLQINRKEMIGPVSKTGKRSRQAIHKRRNKNEH